MAGDLPRKSETKIDFLTIETGEDSDHEYDQRGASQRCVALFASGRFYRKCKPADTDSP
jgi:hypothetical protein